MASMRWMCGAALVAILGTAAGADVKAGADAWSRGDYAAAIAQWQGPAAAGDPDAQFDLGQAYRLGRGVPRDLARAEALFAKAAARGHVQAADNYGLLMFDRGERQAALPYVRAAAERGDARAQYLMGIAHFNGDLAPRDWARAYALMTLAQGAGLPQAAAALAQMDQHIPLAQRQAAATLATQLARQADARRTSQLAAADLAEPAAPISAPTSTPRPAVRQPAAPLRPETALSAAVRTAQGSSPATAGADYARPAAGAAPKPLPQPLPKPAAVAAAPKPVPAFKPAEPAKPKLPPAPAPASPWRVQLGAFSVPANADALWAKARLRPELAGHPRLNVPVGKVVKLQAGGFASREAAGAACTALGKAAIACVPAQD